MLMSYLVVTIVNIEKNKIVWTYNYWKWLYDNVKKFQQWKSFRKNLVIIN